MLVLTFREETWDEQGVFAEVCFHIAWHDHSITPSADPVLDKAILNFKCEGKCYLKPPFHRSLILLLPQQPRFM